MLEVQDIRLLRAFGFSDPSLPLPASPVPATSELQMENPYATALSQHRPHLRGVRVPRWTGPETHGWPRAKDFCPGAARQHSNSRTVQTSKLGRCVHQHSEPISTAVSLELQCTHNDSFYPLVKGIRAHPNYNIKYPEYHRMKTI